MLEIPEKSKHDKYTSWIFIPKLLWTFLLSRILDNFHTFEGQEG